MTLPFMSIHMFICIGFPNHIQPEANIHFNTLLFSTHKAVITLWGLGSGEGDLISTAY